MDAKHETDCVYGYIPPEENVLKQGYIGETNVRIHRRSKEHARWDKQSSIYKFGQEKGITISFEDFQILERGYPKDLDRKIAEALYIKQHEPVLNAQKSSFKLKLFN